MRLEVAMLLAVTSTAVVANELTIRRLPVVVYESQSTISAWPYLKRLEQNQTNKNPVSLPEGAGITSMTQQLPLTPSQLKVGKPDITVQAGQIIPLFVMGMDSMSMHWFSHAAGGLADIGARGVVVQATDAGEWQSLQQHANNLGIDLMLLPDLALAQGYQIDTYPMVIVSPALAREGLSE